LLLAGTLTARPSVDQDPIYDHANGNTAAVTSTSAAAYTPPAGCKFVQVYASADTYIRTDDAPASLTDGKGALVQGLAAPSIHPVTAGVPIRAITATTATVTFLPFKVRS
jgi:hypothetical protein